MADSRLISFLQAVERKVNAVPIRRMWALLIDFTIFRMLFSPIYSHLDSPWLMRGINNLLSDYVPVMPRLVGLIIYDRILQISNLYAVLLWAIYVVITSRFLKCTPGMLSMELRFRDGNGGDPSLYQMMVRHFTTYISALPLFLGYIWMFFDKKHRTWHDMISGVVIVDKSE
ncbi:MAG: RDD family protein [Armatimonadota bacterium]